MDSLSVLAVAYACRPDQGSEAGVGWGWVNAIARNHRVTVITADFNLPAIERHRQENPGSITPNLRFVYVRNRPWHYRPQGAWLKIENSIAKPLMNLAYQDWLRCAFQTARAELSHNPCDLLHLITYVGWRFPGRFYELDLPFVWGPIGGLVNTPWRLLPAMGLGGAVYYGGRNVVNSLQMRLLPGPRRALRKAAGGVIAATSEMQAALRRHFGAPSRVICEVGLPEIRYEEPTERAPGEPLRICWSGLHLPGKALHLLLKAAARLRPDVDYRIHILGDGPSKRAWRALARRLGVNERCQWHGQLPRSQAMEVMKQSHVFVITSLKDLTSNVAAEAIGLGVPVVCLDHCGFADLVTSDCGIKVAPLSLDEIVAGLARAIGKLHDDEPLRLKCARGAALRSNEYTWQRKMLRLGEVYEEACGAARREGAPATRECSSSF